MSMGHRVVRGGKMGDVTKKPLTNANVYCSSTDHLMMSCNMQTARNFERKSAHELIGRYYYELWPSAEAAVYINNNEKVMRSKHAMWFTESASLEDGSIRTYISYKYPMLDRKNRVLGVMGESIEVSQIPKEFSEAFSVLSEQEQHCFRLLLKGHSIKAVGNFMHLSPRTIEHYAANIRSKLKCKNTKELIATYLLLK